MKRKLSLVVLFVLFIGIVSKAQNNKIDKGNSDSIISRLKTTKISELKGVFGDIYVLAGADGANIYRTFDEIMQMQNKQWGGDVFKYTTRLDKQDSGRRTYTIYVLHYKNNEEIVSFSLRHIYNENHIGPNGNKEFEYLNMSTGE